jgi:hypothetical protein
MGNDNKNNQNTILNAKVATKAPEASESELNAALGKVVPAVEPKVEAAVTTTTTTTTATTATPETITVKSKLDRLVEGLSPANKALLDSLKGSPKLEEIASALFAAEHPQGMVKDFLVAVIDAVKKSAGENLVKVDGCEVLVRFPVGDGLTPNAEFVKVGTYRAAEAKGEAKGKTAEGTKKGWGKVEVLADGKTMNYLSLGDASKPEHENISTGWAANMVEAFRKAGYTDIVDITDGHAITVSDTPQGHGVRMTRPQ